MPSPLTLTLAWRSFCANGACGHFGKAGEGSAGLILFNSKEGQFDYSIEEIVPCLLLGVIGGCGGALFIHINTQICVWRRDHQKGKRKASATHAQCALKP